VRNFGCAVLRGWDGRCHGPHDRGLPSVGQQAALPPSSAPRGLGARCSADSPVVAVCTLRVAVLPRSWRLPCWGKAGFWWNANPGPPPPLPPAFRGTPPPPGEKGLA